MDTETIQSCIEELLQKLTLPYSSIEIEETELNTTFHIETDDAPLLIGNNGETLSAFSYLIRRIVYKKAPDGAEVKKFGVDVNHYQEKKLEEFKQEIQESAKKVRLLKQPLELPSMSSYKRMIVHSLFSDDIEISTHSEGEGKFRKVILTYKDN